VLLLQCNIGPAMQNPNPWPVFIQRNDLNTGLFLRTCLGGGHLQKGTILYWVWRDEWMTDGCWWQKVWCDIVCTSRGVWGILPQNIVCIFPPLGLKCEHFLKQIFGYTALHCALIDQIWSVKCTCMECMVCLCKYHNWVTQGVGSLLNLVGPTPTRRYRGSHQSRLLEMAYSGSSFCYLWL
jgi:hypothetical protein